MKILDWAVIVAYLFYVIWDGVRRSAGSRDTEGYFLAGRTLPWWAVGLSVMATQMSAITLVGTTGQAYTNGMRFIQFYYGLPFAMIILCMTAVPFFYRAKIFTAYEYLEKRFDARTRTLTSFVFLVSRCLGVGVIISAPSVILSIVLGWNLPATVFSIGISTTIYTMIGGVQAVTWTDVKQMVVIIVGLGVCLYVILHKLPISFGQALEIAGATGRLTTIDTHFDPHETYTLWSGLIGGFFLMLSYFGCDQSQVQRYLSAKSVSDGRTSLLMSAFLKIPIQFGILLIGVMVFVFYQFEKPPLNFNQVEESKVQAGSRAAAYKSVENRFQQTHEIKRQLAFDYVHALNTHDSARAEAAKESFL
ncbi:MAG: sodium:solute symporter family transporter, partial [Pyrinomonadaceae bacterium]